MTQYLTPKTYRKLNVYHSVVVSEPAVHGLLDLSRIMIEELDKTQMASSWGQNQDQRGGSEGHS